MDIFNNLQVAGECLLDFKRTRAFEKGINEIVKANDVVLDAGTGSGILSLFAAKAGAKKVYSVDIAEDVVMNTKRNFEASPFKDKIEVILSNLTTFKAIKNVDVLIMEMLDTGLISEQQAVAINNLRKNGVINEKTRMIPYRVICTVQAVQYDFNFYGFNMPFIIAARNYGVNTHVEKKLSENIIYKDLDLQQYIETEVNVDLTVPIEQTGNFNGIRLKTKVFLSPNVSLWGTADMNMPIIIPVKNLKVKQGDIIKLNIRYKMSEGFNNFYVSVIDP